MKNALILYACCLVQLTFNSRATTRYVDVGSTNPVPPFTAWNTAATNIQAAVGAAFSGDTVLVTNGFYNSGGSVSSDGGSNRVSTSQAISIRSVNGPSVTTIAGSNNVRCVYLSSGATLSGFTLTNGHGAAGGGAYCTDISPALTNCVLVGNVGGGVFRGTLQNCVLSNNISFGGPLGGGASSSRLTGCRLINNTNGSHSSGFGGGAYSSILTNCVVSGNWCGYQGGGAYQSTLAQCIVSDNYCDDSGAGGAELSTLFNCVVVRNFGGIGGVHGQPAFNSIIYYNTNRSFSSGVLLTNCCVSGVTPVGGANNITNEPLFLDLAGGDLELQSNSPCINSGNNFYNKAARDLAGNPRVAGATVDIGPYEFQSPASILSLAWAQQYGIATDGSADYADPDGDEFNNWQEWMAGTIPTDQGSILRMLSLSNDTSGLTIRWQSVPGKKYLLQRNTAPSAPPDFVTLQYNIAGQADVTAYLDVTATNDSNFYRVQVQQGP